MSSIYRLSNNFTLPEICKSNTASRLGIINTPMRGEEQNLLLLSRKVLQPVRDHFNKIVKISSGFRCLELNRALKSKDSSQHIKGEAADFEIPGYSNLELVKWIRENLEFDQLILEYYEESDGYPNSGWVHCSYTRYQNRNNVLTINNRGTFEGIII